MLCSAQNCKAPGVATIEPNLNSAMCAPVSIAQQYGQFAAWTTGIRLIFWALRGSFRTVISLFVVTMDSGCPFA